MPDTNKRDGQPNVDRMSLNTEWQSRKVHVKTRDVGVLTPAYAPRAEISGSWDVEGNRHIDFVGAGYPAFILYQRVSFGTPDYVVSMPVNLLTNVNRPVLIIASSAADPQGDVGVGKPLTGLRLSRRQ